MNPEGPKGHRLSKSIQIPYDSLKGVIEEFKDFLAVDKDLAERTVRGYSYDVQNFLREHGLDSVNKKQIRKWVKQYENKNTRANKIKALKSFFRDFLDASHLVESFKIPNTPNNDEKPPEKEELQEFYKYLSTPKHRAFFLIKASSGLRLTELTGLKIENVDLDKRMLKPNHESRTKRSYVSFYTEEAEKVLNQFLEDRKENDNRFFQVKARTMQYVFSETSEKSGIKIKAKDLRKWFVNEMKKLGVDPGYIDAFCGRVPKTVQDSHYTDLSPERLKEVYEKAGLKVLV